MFFNTIVLFEAGKSSVLAVRPATHLIKSDENVLLAQHCACTWPHAEQVRTGRGKAEGLGAGLLQPREGFGLGGCLSASL